MSERIVYLTQDEPGDFWSDILVAPEGLDFAAALVARARWYDDEYVLSLRAGQRPRYINRIEWLIERHGCRRPTDAEVLRVELP